MPRSAIKAQHLRRLAQGGFFALFVLAPVFDLLRLDLTLGHFFFLGQPWTLGLDAFADGRIGSGEAALNLVLRAFLPLIALVAGGVWLAWRFGRLYCGWLCPHFSVVELLNGVLRRAIARHSVWDRHPLPERTVDGRPLPRNAAWWALFLPLAAGFAALWAVALLTYLLPPAEVYGNLWHGTLTRNQGLFLGVATLVFFLEFVFARHLFCRFGCAVGLFQSLAWMGNRRALVIGYDRRRAKDCAECDDACDHACPMRLHPRAVKRHMFACTQCRRCEEACTHVQRGAPAGPLLRWVQGDCALDKSAREFGHKVDIPAGCYAPPNEKPVTWKKRSENSGTA